MWIGICSQSRMGKDTFADFLQSSNSSFGRKAFSDELKLLISKYFDVTLEDIEYFKTCDVCHPNCNIPMRKVLQTVGESMRSVHPDVWVNQALTNCKENCIFTDVRYDNEMKALLEKKAVLILIGRTNCLNSSVHPSETGVRNAISWFLENTTDLCVRVKACTNIPKEFQHFEYFVRNDATLDELKKNATSIMLSMSEWYG
jgi:hypothetical protein